MNKKKKVVVQGLGYVGAAMATAIASKTNEYDESIYEVIGVELSTRSGIKKINSINSGNLPFNTNDASLSLELSKAVKKRALVATHKKSMYSEADFIIVSINCDLKTGNNIREIDLKPFSDSVLEIVELMPPRALLIIESTVPPGTCKKIIYPMMRQVFKRRGLNEDSILLAHSYERVMPGKDYLHSITNFWRVYSGINTQSADKCKIFLSSFIDTNKYPLSRLKNTTSTETSKLLENSYRAVNIAFIDEWANFAEKTNVDLYEVIDAIRLRPTHSNISQPGFGVGGYCLTKDPLFADIAARQILNINDLDFPFSKLAVEINSKMPLQILKKLANHYEGNLKNKSILLMGLTYKEDVADTRFSASETFYKEAKKIGCKVDVYDPLISFWEETKIKIKPDIPSLIEYDAIIFSVAHKEFSALSFKKVKISKGVLIFDANNVLTNEQKNDINNDNNLRYISVGRG